jgi:hypothetical protein
MIVVRLAMPEAGAIARLMTRRAPVVVSGRRSPLLQSPERSK